MELKTKETFEIIRSATEKLVDMVKLTFGPASNKVIIDKQIYRMTVDDGVQIARDLELEDPAENAVLKVIRETAIKTNDRIGDGTTHSLLMLHAILSEVAKKPNFNGRKIEKELKQAVSEVVEHIKKNAKQIKDVEELKKVARVSFDNKEIADLIAETYWSLGEDAVITVDRSPTMETYVEMSEGIKIENGYISPYMITNPERMESVIENPYILFTDYRLTEANDIIPIMNKLAEQNKRELVIIAENVEQHALATAVLNKVQGKFLVLAVTAPKGDDRKVFMEDLALMTGARMFTESKGDKVEEATIEDLGRAKRFVCRRDESIIVEPKGDKETVNDAISKLALAVSNEKKDKDKEKAKKRLARLTNKLAVVKVGAATDNEQKALKYKVEDAVYAVRSALKDGVVRGSGLTTANIKTSSYILNEALKYPSRQLFENMGLDIMDYNFKKDEALNVVSGEIGNYMEVGVIDPAQVLIAGVESAVSIASILLTSKGMIIETPKKD